MTDNINVQILEPSINILEIETQVGSEPIRVDVISYSGTNISITHDLPVLPGDINDNIASLLVAGSGISLNYSPQIPSLTISSSGVTTENIQDIIASFISGVSYISVNYDDNNNILYISATGLQPSGNYALANHNHTSNQITDFNSSVSGLLPVKNISSGSGINVTNNNGDFIIAVTGTFGLTSEEVDDRVSNLLVGGSNIVLNYNDFSNQLTISTSGLQPSGNYSVVGHNHIISDVSGLQNALDNKQPSGIYASGVHYHVSADISDFNISVSGLLPSISGSGYINSSFINNSYIITVSGLQPSGNYSIVGHSHSTSDITNFSSGVNSLVSGIYAPLNSPNFSGIPTAPTASSGTNNTQVASTAFVRNEISNLIDSAPSTLDTLNELAAALGDDPNFATTVTNLIAGKVSKSGDTMTGVLYAPSGVFSSGLTLNGNTVSVIGHTHTSSDITDFNSSVSGLLQPPFDQSLNTTDSPTFDDLTISGTLSAHGSSVTIYGQIDDGPFRLIFQDTTPVYAIENYRGGIGFDAGQDLSTYIFGYGSNPIVIRQGDETTLGDLKLGSVYFGDDTAQSTAWTGTVDAINVSGLSLVATSNSYTDLDNIPSSFSPSAHASTHLPSGTDQIFDQSLNTTDSPTFNTIYSSRIEFPDYSEQTTAWIGVVGVEEILNFDSEVSGLIPVKDIVAGSGISVSSTSGIYTIDANISGVILETIQDNLGSGFLVAGTGVQLTYNDQSNTLTLDNLHTEINELSLEPQGFVNRLDSIISFNDSTRTFTIAPSGSSYDIYIEGIKVTKTSSESIVIGSGTALNYIHFNTDTGLLDNKTTPFNFDTDVPIAFIHWNNDINQSTFFGEERHGIRMDSSTHKWIHNTFGMQYISGLSIGGYTLLGNGTSNSHAQIDISDGILYQEDIIINIADGNNGIEFTQQLSPIAYIPVYYHLGTTGQWVRDTATPYPLKYNSTRALYNLYSGGTWTTPNLTNNRYFAMWIVATNDINDPILAIMGQREDSSLSSAENNNIWSDINLINIPTNELRPLYRLIFVTNDTFTNTPKSSLQSILDIRKSVITSTYGVSQNDHGNLFGLGDDDHTQYVHINEARTISANHTFSNGLTITGGTLSATSGNFTSLNINGTGVSVSGHNHTTNDISDFNSGVSGLLPVTNIVGGTNISVIPSGTSFTVSVSGSLGLTTEEVDDRVSNLLVAGTGISLSYNDNANTLTISTTKNTILSDVVSSTNYIGIAPAGTLVSESLWKIKRTIYSTSGTISSTGVATNVAWTDRLIASYS